MKGDARAHGREVIRGKAGNLLVVELLDDELEIRADGDVVLDENARRELAVLMLRGLPEGKAA